MLNHYLFGCIFGLPLGRHLRLSVDKSSPCNGLKAKLEALLDSTGDHKKWGNLVSKNHDTRGTRDSQGQKWRHPGGKLRELGADKLTDAELLSILISTGIRGKPAEKIAEEILNKFGSFKGMADQPLEKFLEIKGLADVKIIRISAAFEIARRIVNHVLSEERLAVEEDEEE